MGCDFGHSLDSWVLGATLDGVSPDSPAQLLHLQNEIDINFGFQASLEELRDLILNILDNQLDNSVFKNDDHN